MPGILLSFVLLPLMIVVSLQADETTFEKIGGDLPKLLTSDKSPYLVISDVYVPAGKICRIEQGTVLLFKNFTGLHVQGILTAHGSKGAPIVFTSENDKKYNPLGTHNPTPYDWNGIYIHKDGIGSDLEHIRISYSVKGIVTETKFIRISEGVFHDNGRSNLTIEGQEKEVTNAPFSYNLSVKDASVEGVPITILRDPDAPRRNIIRYSGLALVVGGGALGGIFGAEWNSSTKAFKDVSSPDTPNTIIHVGEDWEEARLERNRSMYVTLGGITAALLGAVGFSWSFTF
jgi:hypothetical protein